MRAATKLEQWYRHPAQEAAFGGYGGCHQHAGLSDVIKFLAIAAPARFGATSAGHLPFAGSARKSRDVDLPISGFARGIRHPLTVRRNLARTIRTASLDKWFQLSTACGNQKQPGGAATGSVRQPSGAQNLLVIQRPRVGQNVLADIDGE